MHDLFKSWLLRRFLLLEPLEARYCFSAVSAESIVLIDRTLPNDSILARAIVPGRGGDWVLEAASAGAATQTVDAPLNLAALAQWNSTLAAGVTVSPTFGLITTEGGGQDTFTVVLDQAPTDDVTIPISSSDATEGTTDVSQLVFNTSNWATPQTVTVTGVQDFTNDGNQAYSILTGAAVSNDPAYNGLDP